jgi:hypothetical protein
MSRRLLQVVTAILSLIPIATGIIAMTGIDDPLYAALDLPRSPLLDSNLSAAFVGLPPVPFIGFTALEIVGAPLFVFWQKQVERSHPSKA